MHDILFVDPLAILCSVSAFIVVPLSIRFSVIPQRCHPEGASPSEISRHCMDLSYTLESLMASSHAHCEKETKSLVVGLLVL